MYLKTRICDFKNAILNRLIQFLLKHCYVYCQTIFAFVDKVPSTELKWFIDEWERYKKEVMIND